jgi:uncharacterized DUF497 family protein
MPTAAQPFFSSGVLEKLTKKHNVAVSEVLECFANRRGKSLTDSRVNHATNPPTRWFVAETDMGRKLKVVYMIVDNSFEIKTAYPANQQEMDIYMRVAGVRF